MKVTLAACSASCILHAHPEIGMCMMARCRVAWVYYSTHGPARNWNSKSKAQARQGASVLAKDVCAVATHNALRPSRPKCFRDAVEDACILKKEVDVAAGAARR